MKKIYQEFEIVNLTAHDVNICDDNGNIIKTFKPSGTVARISHGWQFDVCGTEYYYNGVPIVDICDQQLVGLPDYDKGSNIIYIVSNIVLDWVKNHERVRFDLVSPAQQVRRNGKVIGCKSFVK